jgi:hypothetical protein
MMRTRSAFTFGCAIMLSFLVGGCTDEDPRTRAIQKGKELAEQSCSGCHQLPDPNLLNKETWRDHVLPKMSGYFGLQHQSFGTYFETGDTTSLSIEQWKLIQRYYVGSAPDVLADSQRSQIIVGNDIFTASPVAVKIASPITTFVGFRAASKNILFADRESLVFLDSNGRFKDSVRAPVGVTDLDSIDGSMLVTSMGVLYPSDERKGKLSIMNTDGSMRVLMDSLQRPVHLQVTDLNNDNREDLIVCQFGNLQGRLSWMENQGSNGFREHILRPAPGAIRTEIRDMNADGLPDILALMAQGDEGIFLYTNKGSGKFEEKQILRFPASYGSNFFGLADFNNDGYEDIIVTAGDNGDYPPILKPYHGVRIYINDRSNKYAEAAFLAVNGAYKALARDFDMDGDADIAVISFFPDYDKHPEESFIYFRNNGNLSFTAYSVPEHSAGRWLTMDAADIDNDGDLDILLGNAVFGMGNVPESVKANWKEYSPSILILTNNTR